MRQNGKLAYQVNLLGRRFRIEGPRSEIEDFRQSLFEKCIEVDSPPPDESFALQRDEEVYTLFRDGEGPICETDLIGKIYWLLDYEICFSALRHCRRWLNLHGAGLAKEGRATVILGESRSGKSTLAAKMLLAGYRFLGDDILLLAPESLKLRAFPRNLLLRERSLQTDAELGSVDRGRWTYMDGEGERKWLLAPEAFGSDFATQDCEVGDLIWLVRSEGDSPEMTPIGMREMIELMIQQSGNLKEMFEAGLNAIVELAQRGRNFRLTAPDPHAAWERLRAHLLAAKSASSEEARR